jgi:predicted transcriptional regulator of viral defense system
MDFLTLQRTLQELNLNIFSLNDLVKISGQKKDVIKSKLTLLVKQKKIFRLKKGYYSLFKIENKFQLQNTYKGTYIATHSALEYYESTTQRFNNLDLITYKIMNDQKIQDVSIQFHKVKKDVFFGFEKMYVGDVEVFISNIEKTIIDCIYFSSKVYLTETIDFIKKYKEKIRVDLLIEYLNKINSSTLNKRTGYLLEMQGIALEGVVMNDKYEKLNKNLSNKGIKNKKWKLIINEAL